MRQKTKHREHELFSHSSFYIKKSGVNDIFDWLIDWCRAGGLGLLGCKMKLI
jgi:hypothetical protein